MNHPELLIIPAMILSDYFLTVWGAVLSEKKYRQHFKIEHYELNPIWQKSIAQKQWFNLRFVGMVALATMACVLWSSGWTTPDDFMEGLFGFVVILEAGIIGQHLSNILTFFYLIRHPECVSGEITMSHLLSLNLSIYRSLTLFVPLVLIVIFSPAPFVIGGVFSQLFLFILHLRWLGKARARVQANKPV